ncbi:SWIM zinc finger family protein [Streptomyces sp. BK208]|uniref:SWIM zinc finger family protein n=1 Tax=Streptomyces sp. BK208 TaxID=2512150 RepID=UPI001FBB4E30|nr:SWIM zinc finger family protein [Streptomyces sp. BK208]
MAREALRAARRQAKVDAAREGQASTRRSSRPSGRQHRAGGAGTEDARARAVRDFVSGAFRLPADWDTDADVEMDRDAGVGPAVGSLPVGEPESAGEPGSAGKRARGSSAEDRTAPSREPELEGEPEPEPESEAEQGPSPERHSEWERERTSRPERQPQSTRQSGSERQPGPERQPESIRQPGSARQPESTREPEEGEEGPEGEPTRPSPRAVPATGAAPAQPPAQVPTHAPASPRPARAADATEASVPAAERPRHPEPASAARGRAASSSPPATPRAPRSMAAPGRDGELRRTFPALAPRTAADEGFAGTWWGNAWVTALEEGALDAARLERGRGYAERGHVDAITVTPGLVLAYVQGGRARPYRVQMRLRTLSEADWDRFLDAAVERPGHIAALLDKELPHSLADLADRGVPLLPGPGDLTPQCSCPDSGHPCKHAAALCYQTARLLDADPFVLLLLRGRGERELLDALSRRNAARAARAAQDRGPAPLPGVRAGEALARRVLPPLPAPLPVPPHPEQPPAYPAAPGGPDPFALDQLATDAAARAHALLATGCDPVGGLTLWQDAVRLAAARPGSGLTAGTRALYASLASAAGRDTAELARAVAAWRQGGPEGLDVLEEPWDPPAGRFDRARPLLLAADLPAFRPWRNRLTHPRGHVQLRLGRSGLWFAYESEPDREDWWPRGTPDLDPVGALTGLGTRVDL